MLAERLILILEGPEAATGRDLGWLLELLAWVLLLLLLLLLLRGLALAGLTLAGGFLSLEELLLRVLRRGAMVKLETKQEGRWQKGCRLRDAKLEVSAIVRWNGDGVHRSGK